MAEKDINMSWKLLLVLASMSYTSGFNIVCYYTNWAQYRPDPYKFFPENIDPSLCTYLSYSFCMAEGLNVVTYEWNDDAMIKRFMKMKEKQPRVKTLIAIGGYNAGTTPFIELCKNDQNRETFARNAAAFVRKHNFDGFELDWEYPNATFKDDFASLVQKLREVFEDEAKKSGKTRIILGAALAAGKQNIDAGLDIPKLSRYIDLFNVMTYDFHGSWEDFCGMNCPLYAYTDEVEEARNLNIDWVANYYVSLGTPKHKMNIGIASYGRSFTLQDSSQHTVLSPTKGAGAEAEITLLEGVMANYEVCEFIKKGATVHQVESQGNPYALKGDQWVGYDDEASVTKKANYIKDNGYAGAIFWNLDFDDFRGRACDRGKYPLLRSINKVFFTDMPFVNEPDPTSKPLDCPKPGKRTDGKGSDASINVQYRPVGILALVLALLL